MSKRAQSLEVKISVIKAFKEESYTLSELESFYNIHKLTIYDWVYKYEKYGVEGLKEISTWGKYSK